MIMLLRDFDVFVVNVRQPIRIPRNWHALNVTFTDVIIFRNVQIRYWAGILGFAKSGDLAPSDDPILDAVHRFLVPSDPDDLQNGPK